MESMKLDGGIDTYQRNKRVGTGNPPLGRKVVFLNKNGYEREQEVANRHFTENQVLTVKEIYVGRSNSKVEFVEFPSHRFNTVMFGDVPRVSPVQTEPTVTKQTLRKGE